MMKSQAMTPSMMSLMNLVMIFPIMMMLLSNNLNNLIMKWEILLIQSLSIDFPILFDKTSISFCLLVTSIFMSVMTFSKFYMKMEKNKNRFNWLVILFVISMFMLILIPNLLSLLLGWDGLGITSFCLVIYFQNYKSLASGMITAIMNRIGDAAIIVSIAWMSMNSHWNIYSMEFNKINFILICMITLAAMTKSAQIPFSSWLPAAMAAPTPVSALVHSSTLVTAGVFLMIRFFPFSSKMYMYSSMMMMIGSSTMIMASISAFKEKDFKKIIALSTLSQLGLMFMALSLSLPNLALMHLYTHAMFKAMLFIIAGTIISMSSGNQDLRLLSKITNKSNLLMISAVSSNIALMGFPFLSGFYSKELIINFMMSSKINTVGVMIMILSISLTVIYSLRTMSMSSGKKTMLTPFSSNVKNYYFLFKPIFILIPMVISLGTILMWTMSPFESMPFNSKKLSIIPFDMIIFGMMIIWIKSNKSKKIIKKKTMKKMNQSMWFLTKISSTPINSSFFKLTNLMEKSMDKGWSEFIGPQGLFNKMNMLSMKIKFMMLSLITMSFISLILLMNFQFMYF